MRRKAVQKCKSAYGLCKGGKVSAAGGRERQLGWYAVPTLPEAWDVATFGS